MKIFKILSTLLLLLSFTSCKKESAIEVKKTKEPFDITTYVMVGKTVHNSLITSATQQYLLPFITTFDAQNKSKTILLTGESNYSFTYANGVITSGNERFVVDEDKLKAYNEKDVSEVFQLVKIPNGNLFNGHSYSGGWKTRSSSLLFLATLKFSDYQFNEATLNEPTVNKNYTLIKNIAGIYKSQEEVHFWVHIDGKLESSKANYVTATVYTGVFNQK